MRATPESLSSFRNLSLMLVIGLVLSSPALGEDWPQFRGSHQDGISREAGIELWGAGGPEVLWRTELGQGFSGITVVGDLIFTMFGDGDEEWVACFRAATGEEVWRYRIDEMWQDRQGDGPRSTPTAYGDKLFATSASGTFVALDAGSGRPLWKHDLVKDFGAEIPQWGFSASPVIEEGKLLLEVGGKGALLMAFDPDDGQELWRSQNGKAGYSTPLLVTVHGVRHAIFFTADGLYAVSPNDGSLLWSQGWKTSWDVNATMPIFLEPDRLFVSSGYDVGSSLYEIQKKSDRLQLHELWHTRSMKNRFSTSISYQGHLYGFDEKTFKCIDAGTGEEKWKVRKLGHGSLLLSEGTLVVLGEEGQLVLAEATPDAFREKARTEIFSGKSWTVPTLSGGRLYLRDENELIALNVSAD